MSKLSLKQIEEIYEKLKNETDPSERRRLKYLLNVQYGKFGDKDK